MADSGYESFNTFAHLIRKGMYFVIRMKDINSNGILSAYDLSDSEFDNHIRTTLTRRHTKETLGNPNTYTILQPSTDFDFLDENCMYYDIEFRIVRVRLDNGTYICIATNLSEEEFPLEDSCRHRSIFFLYSAGENPVTCLNCREKNFSSS